MVREQTCDEALGARCLDILVREVGPVDTERFVAYMNREKFDYTEWQQTLFAGQSIEEIAEQARAVGAQFRNSGARGPTSPSAAKRCARKVK